MKWLLVDDDRAFTDTLSAALKRRGQQVTSAASANAAIKLAGEFHPARILVDLRMPGESGLAVVRALASEAAIVVLTGYGSIPTAIEAIKLGAVHYLTKPVELEEIEAAFAGHAPLPQTPAPTLDEAKRTHIERVLHDSNNNISEAARRLKLHRRSLQRILQKL